MNTLAYVGIVWCILVVVLLFIRPYTAMIERLINDPSLKTMEYKAVFIVLPLFPLVICASIGISIKYWYDEYLTIKSKKSIDIVE